MKVRIQHTAHSNSYKRSAGHGAKRLPALVLTDNDTTHRPLKA